MLLFENVIAVFFSSMTDQLCQPKINNTTSANFWGHTVLLSYFVSSTLHFRDFTKMDEKE